MPPSLPQAALNRVLREDVWGYMLPHSLGIPVANTPDRDVWGYVSYLHRMSSSLKQKPPFDGLCPQPQRGASRGTGTPVLAFIIPRWERGPFKAKTAFRRFMPPTRAKQGLEPLFWPLSSLDGREGHLKQKPPFDGLCPQGDSNPCFGLERATSWATRRWGLIGTGRILTWLYPPVNKKFETCAFTERAAVVRCSLSVNTFTLWPEQSSLQTGRRLLRAGCGTAWCTAGNTCRPGVITRHGCPSRRCVHPQ